MKNKKRRGKGITLVLSGGGAKGLAHIGVIEVLVKDKIPIKRIVGTSAGALVGGFYAAGKIKELKNLFLSLNRWEVYKLFFSFPSREGIFNSKKIDLLLKNYLSDIKIEKLKIPFTAVAFDMTKNEKVLFEKGSLFNAIRASISIPSYFKPFQLGNSMFIDGGIVDVMPVDVAKRQSKRLPIVGVNVEVPPIIKIDRFNIFTMFDYARNHVMTQISRLEGEGADVIIEPKNEYGHWEYDKAKEIIESGRKEAKKLLPKIRRLLK